MSESINCGAIGHGVDARRVGVEPDLAILSET